MQPRWVQVALNARYRPATGCVTTTPSASRSGKIRPPPTGMSPVWMTGRAAGGGALRVGRAPQPASAAAPAAPAPPSTARRLVLLSVPMPRRLPATYYPAPEGGGRRRRLRHRRQERHGGRSAPDLPRGVL